MGLKVTLRAPQRDLFLPFQPPCLAGTFFIASESPLGLVVNHQALGLAGMWERAWRELGQCIISGGDNPQLIMTLALLQTKTLCRRVGGSAFGRRVQLRQRMGSAEAASASEPRAEDGVQPHSHIQVQTVP